jgi:hypothetical protein
MDRMCDRTLIERDDQLALNHLIGRAGTGSRKEIAGALRFTALGATFVCADPAMVSRTLESGEVIRHFQQDGRTVEQVRQALGLS